MNDIYAEADQLFQDPENEAEVRELYARWNAKDPDLVALWKKTRQWSSGLQLTVVFQQI